MNEALEDKQLIENAKADPEQFAALYNKYINKIYQFIYYRVKNDKDTAFDLSAEVFTRALKNLPNFQWQGFPYSAYLYRTARSLCQEHYGKKIAINIDDIVIKDESSVTNPDKTDLLILWDEIRKLKPPLPEIFELHFLKGLSYEEIGEIIGKNSGAIRTAISRAISNLQKKYGQI